MRNVLEDLALKAFMGATLIAIVGLASVHVWAMSKSEFKE